MNNFKKAIVCAALLIVSSLSAVAAEDENAVVRQRLLDSLNQEMKNLSSRIQAVYDADKSASLSNAIESVSTKQKPDAANTQKCLSGLLGYSELNKKYSLGSEKQLILVSGEGENFFLVETASGRSV